MASIQSVGMSMGITATKATVPIRKRIRRSSIKAVEERMIVRG